jgi:polyferredoxin
MFTSLNQQVIFQDDLLNGEEILWLGRPDPSVNFNKMDFFLVPFTFLWAGFAFFSVYSYSSTANNFPIAFMIPFLAISLILLIPLR